MGFGNTFAALDAAFHYDYPRSGATTVIESLENVPAITMDLGPPVSGRKYSARRHFMCAHSRFSPIKLCENAYKSNL